MITLTSGAEQVTDTDAWVQRARPASGAVIIGFVQGMILPMPAAFESAGDVGHRVANLAAARGVLAAQGGAGLASVVSARGRAAAPGRMGRLGLLPAIEWGAIDRSQFDWPRRARFDTNPPARAPRPQ